MPRLKIGAVSYLNTKPLVEGLEEGCDRFELVYDLPSRLADRLQAGELAAALIPSIEANSKHYTIVSDACIGCWGPVWSVKLLSRVSPEKIRTLALDEGSRTSCILAQVLLAKNFAVYPETKSLGISENWRDVEADAVLIIGDRAMKIPNSGFKYCWDLGTQWQSLTGLPFVFAVWAARDGEHLDELDRLLTTARDTGLTNLAQIAQRYAARYGLTTAECRHYFSENLNFEFGSPQKTGLSLFFQFAAELSLVSNQQLRFYDSQTAC